MKTLLLSVCYMFCCVIMYAQQSNRDESFETYSSNQNNLVVKLFADKNYVQLISLLEEWKEKYERLTPEQRNTYKSVGTNAIYYNLVCAYSLTNQKDKAIDYFKKIIGLGYNDRAHTEEDTDLDNIRKDKRFIKLFAGMPKKDSYIELLQKSGAYASMDTTGLPHFNYEDINNFRIQSVKNYFHLDSIAGQGDEMSKIVNLMTWVHNTIRHDGNHMPNNSEFDAMDLYNYYKTTGCGINCRMLAIVLNECYLSMGFKSRFVTCLPKDETDSDCHVINCVYSKTLNKWVWMDPTFNAYLKDENGKFLSIEEVRNRLIKNQPIVLNEDANWNNENKQTKKQYVDNYMAKNLYWIQCPANSYFNVESPYRNSTQTYVSLAPSGFEPKLIRKNDIRTNDPAYFWQAPVEK